MTLPTLDTPSFLTGLGRGFESGAKTGFSSISDLILSKKKREELASQKADQIKEKNLSGAGKYVSGELKHRNPDLALRENEVISRYSDYLNQGLPQSDALMKAIQDISETPIPKDPNQKSLFDILGIKKDEEYPYYYGSALAKHPKQGLADIPISALGGIEKLMDILSLGSWGHTVEGITGKENQGTPLANFLREKAGISDLPQKAQEAIGVGSFATQFLPWTRLLSALGMGGKTAGAAAPLAEIEGALPRQLTYQTSNAAEKTGSLAARTGSALKGATELRTERIAPEGKLFKPKEVQALHQAQKQLYPKYEAEIAQDAAERAARAESKVPKTAGGMQAKELRAKEAEKRFPLVQDSYARSLARVRAIEDQLANVIKTAGAESEAANSSRKIYELAKKDLKEAEFALRQATENLEGTGYRANLQEMKEAARQKLTHLDETISEGEEYNLGARDYSPKMIQNAKRIPKKALPSSRHEDFYTQVHDTYVTEYKNRLGQIEQELANLSKEKPSMFLLSKKHQLGKQKEAINKMIESAEAENKIHRHKLALREIAERKKAQERFSKLQKAEINAERAKTGEVAQQKMWKERIQEAKTSQEKKKVIDEGIEEIIKENPSKAEKIKAEGEKIKSKLGEESEIPLPKGEEIFKGKSASDAASSARKSINDFHKWVDNFLKEVPIIGKSYIGREMLKGALTASWDEFRKENLDVPFTGSVLAASLFGYGKGAFFRVMGNQFAKWAFKEWNIRKAEDALVKKDAKEFNKYPPSIRKKAQNRLYSQKKA